MLIHQGGRSLQKAPELTVAHRDKTLPRIPEHLQESKTHPKKNKITSKNPKCFPDSKTLLDSGKHFEFWEVFWILGSVFGFWDIFLILGSVLGSGTCFSILRSVTGLWDVFWILGHVLSLRATAWTWWSLTKKGTVNSDCMLWFN